MKVISLPETASWIRCRGTGKSLLSQCKIEDAIIIPEGATNGDMIEAMFPNELLTSITSTLWWGDNMSFNKDWWDAPYNPTQNMQNADKSGLEYTDQETLISAT